MIDTSPLYDPLNHRYKGVYRHNGKYTGAKQKPWDAIVETPEGKLLRRGRYATPEEAAIAVAEYYRSVYGPEWAQHLKNHSRSRRTWRIRRFKRYPYRADLHRGPSVTVWIADVRRDDDTWHRITLEDLIAIMSGAVPSCVRDMWDATNSGWKTKTMAVIVLRTYSSTMSTRSREVESL